MELQTWLCMQFQTLVFTYIFSFAEADLWMLARSKGFGVLVASCVS